MFPGRGLGIPAHGQSPRSSPSRRLECVGQPFDDGGQDYTLCSTPDLPFSATVPHLDCHQSALLQGEPDLLRTQSRANRRAPSQKPAPNIVAWSVVPVVSYASSSPSSSSCASSCDCRASPAFASAGAITC